MIIAGIADDTVEGNAGNDTILGDNGTIDFDLDADLSTIDRIEALDISLDNAATSVDTISGNGGADTILGGAAGDIIYGDAAALGVTDLGDVILGDNGILELVGGALTSIHTTDTSGTKGGGDTITGNAGGDIIIAGSGGDAVHGNGGGDTILGDNGRITLVAGVISRVSTVDTDATAGAADTIFGDGGNDLIIGGLAGDDIQGNADDDIIFGDNGAVDFGLDADLSTIDRIEAFDISLDDAATSVDTISGDSGADTILGGAAGDIISGDGGDDTIIGDLGLINPDRRRAVDY